MGYKVSCLKRLAQNGLKAGHFPTRLPGRKPHNHNTSQTDQRGFTLLEVLIAIVLTGIIASGILFALGTSTTILVKTNAQETAKDIAITDMEYIRTLQYANSYPKSNLPALPQNYDHDVTVNSLNLNEQEITITVTDTSGNQLFTLTDYRTNY